MPRKRSRANTEQRFIDAVLELLGEAGCSNLGINLVAQRAGSDKVLIYRYFGDMDGLLERAASSRAWLPTADELRRTATGSPEQILNHLRELIVHHISSDVATHQLNSWRHAVRNPLTERYNADWKQLWKDLPASLGEGLSFRAREHWSKACSLLALTVQAKLTGEQIHDSIMEDAISGLETSDNSAGSEPHDDADSDTLPTNLL